MRFPKSPLAPLGLCVLFVSSVSSGLVPREDAVEQNPETYLGFTGDTVATLPQPELAPALGEALAKRQYQWNNGSGIRRLPGETDYWVDRSRMLRAPTETLTDLDRTQAILTIVRGFRTINPNGPTRYVDFAMPSRPFYIRLGWANVDNVFWGLEGHPADLPVLIPDGTQNPFLVWVSGRIEGATVDQFQTTEEGLSGVVFFTNAAFAFAYRIYGINDTEQQAPPYVGAAESRSASTSTPDPPFNNTVPEGAPIVDPPPPPPEAHPNVTGGEPEMQLVGGLPIPDAIIANVVAGLLFIAFAIIGTR